MSQVKPGQNTTVRSEKKIGKALQQYLFELPDVGFDFTGSCSPLDH
jgi:hypothetical protein